MFRDAKAFSSFSVNDIPKAKEFYGTTLALNVFEVTEMGILEISFPHGHKVMIYPKDDHTPATYTVLNLPIADIDTAVDSLIKKGVVFEQYTDPYIKTDEKGISRGSGGGPSMAWFKDPAGNILALMQE